MATTKKTTKLSKTKTTKSAKSTKKETVRKKPARAADDVVVVASTLDASAVDDARGLVATLGDDETAAQVARDQIAQRYGIDIDSAAKVIADILDEMAAPTVETSKKIGLAQRRLNEVYKMAIQAAEPAVALQAARELNRLECLYNKADRLTRETGDIVDPEKESTREILLSALNLDDSDTTPLDDLARRLVYDYIAKATK